MYRGELFPTRTRSLAGGIIMTSALLGGIIGLVGGGLYLGAAVGLSKLGEQTVGKNLLDNNDTMLNGDTDMPF